MALDTKRLQSISVLGWNFAMHLMKAINPFEKKENNQADLFRSYFQEDRITSLTEREHELLNDFGRCISCGICVDSCRVMEVSEGRFLGPEHIAATSSRSQPEFGADKESLFRCAVCGQCEPRCPEDVPVTAMVMHMRSIIGRIDRDSLPEVYKQFKDNLEKTGMLYGESLVKPSPCRDKGEAILFLGCRESRDAERAERLMEILSKLGITFTTIQESCCGGVPATLGMETGFKLAEKILAEGVDTLIAVCPHCYSALIRDSELEGKVKVRHILEIVMDRLPAGLKIEIAGEAVFHDPCYLARGAGMTELPREILRKAGVRLLEMGEAGLEAPCCGAGGGLSFTDPESAKGVAWRRLKDAEEAGAKILVTECLGCKVNLSSATSNGSAEVSLLTDLLYNALNK